MACFEKMDFLKFTPKNEREVQNFKAICKYLYLQYYKEKLFN